VDNQLLSDEPRNSRFRVSEVVYPDPIPNRAGLIFWVLYELCNMYIYIYDICYYLYNCWTWFTDFCWESFICGLNFEYHQIISNYHLKCCENTQSARIVMEEICLDHFGTKVFEVKAMQTPFFCLWTPRNPKLVNVNPGFYRWIKPPCWTSRFGIVWGSKDRTPK